MLTLAKAKQWLRIDGNYDDEIIQDILDTITQYFKNAIDNFDTTNEEMMKILTIPTIAMLCDMYENRSFNINSSSEKTRFLVQSAILQAQYCYKEDEEE
jgi:uncharacterized phage protein (predicted DNA packaging)